MRWKRRQRTELEPEVYEEPKVASVEDVQYILASMIRGFEKMIAPAEELLVKTNNILRASVRRDHERCCRGGFDLFDEEKAGLHSLAAFLRAINVRPDLKAQVDQWLLADQAVRDAPSHVLERN